MIPPRHDLIVLDKDPALLEHMASVFQCIECSALYLNSAEEVLGICRSEGTRVLITEIQASILDGEVLAREVQNFSPETVLFAMSSQEYDIHMGGGLFHRVFFKPINASQMAAHINLALLGIKSFLNR